MSVTILEHPSDVGIEVISSSLKRAFEEAVYGLISIIIEKFPTEGGIGESGALGSIESLKRREIWLNGIDLENILVKWLSEALYVYDGEKLVPTEAIVTELSSSGHGVDLRGVLYCEQFDPAIHRTKLDVKAVTYHQLLVEVAESYTRLRVFFDI
ncbi:MAG: archease [Bacteroidota bacterium]